MAEQRIVITIDENGKINASMQGIKGEMCLTELQTLLSEFPDWESVTKTDEFYQKITIEEGNTQIIKKGTSK